MLPSMVPCSEMAGHLAKFDLECGQLIELRQKDEYLECSS
jgi:hypothetical protein